MDTTPVKSEDKFHLLCNLAPCQNDRFEYVHRLPLSKERRLEWLKAIHDAGASAYKVKRICGRHFRPDDYIHSESRLLNRNAVPSLNLIDLSQLDKCREIATVAAAGYQVTPGCEMDSLSPNNLKRINEYSVANEDCHENNQIDYKRIKVEISVDEEDGEDNEDGEETIVSEVDHSVDEPNVFLTIENLEEIQSFTSTATIDVNNINEKTAKQEEASCVIVHVKASHTEESQETNPRAVEAVNESIIKTDGRNLVIQHVDFEETQQLDFNWLRDFCKCEECFNSTTGVRKQNLLAHSLNLEPEEATLSEDNMVVKWSNGHTSTYSLVDIFLSQATQATKIISNQIPWIAKHTNFRDDFTPINFNDLICSTIVENAALDRLQRSGVLLIADLSIDAKQQPLMLELLLRRLFPHNYQRLVHEQRTDFSNSPHQLPHTNCSFLSESCGLQILSLCPTINTTTTATFTCLDGFNAALQLRSMARQSFDCLTDFKLPLVYRNVEENFDFCTEASVIDVINDGSLKRIQYAPYQRGVMPQKNLAKFTEALRKLTKIMDNEKNHWTFNLRNDMLIILDNWRICWQLKAQNAAGTEKSNVALNCIYVERKHLLSRLNRLQATDR